MREKFKIMENNCFLALFLEFKRDKIIRFPNAVYNEIIMVDQSARPISPHLQVYKPQLTSVMSIMHRITGVVSFLGSLCLLVWLVALAWDVSLYTFVQPIVSSTIIQIILFLWSLSLIYHLCNGIRHLLWDFGKGFKLEEVYKSGYVVMSASLIITIVIWVSK